jgi:DNA primase
MQFLDKIREAADIVAEARVFMKLKKRGHKYVGLCPFHKEDKPSFTVDREKQLFHCFGCGVGGDVFTLIMEKKGIDFTEAVHYLAQRHRISYSPEDVKALAEPPAPATITLTLSLKQAEELAYAAIRLMLERRGVPYDPDQE